jgi:hypothetical protein
MRSVHPDRPQVARRDFTADVASKGSPTPTITAWLFLNESSTTTIGLFSRNGGLSDVTGFNQPHRTVAYGKVPHHELYRTSNCFASMLIRHQH